MCVRHLANTRLRSPCRIEGAVRSPIALVCKITGSEHEPKTPDRVFALSFQVSPVVFCILCEETMREDAPVRGWLVLGLEARNSARSIPEFYRIVLDQVLSTCLGFVLGGAH